MFFNSSIFWFLMGIVFVLAAAAFKALVRDRGRIITWWKAALALLWYGVFLGSFYTWGTLIGENEGEAGLRVLGLGLLFCAILGAAIWRLMITSARNNPQKNSMR